MLVLEAADQLDRLGNKKARATIAMAKVNFGVSSLNSARVIVHLSSSFGNEKIKKIYWVVMWSLYGTVRSSKHGTYGA